MARKKKEPWKVTRAKYRAKKAAGPKQKARAPKKKATPEQARRAREARAKATYRGALTFGAERSRAAKAGAVLARAEERRASKKAATTSKPTPRPSKPHTRPGFPTAKVRVRAHVRDVGEYSRKFNPSRLPMRDLSGRWEETSAAQMAELAAGSKTRTRRITVQAHERIMPPTVRRFDRTKLPIRVGGPKGTRGRGKFTSAAKQQIGLFGIKR